MSFLGMGNSDSVYIMATYVLAASDKPKYFFSFSRYHISQNNLTETFFMGGGALF